MLKAKFIGFEGEEVMEKKFFRCAGVASITIILFFILNTILNEIYMVNILVSYQMNQSDVFKVYWYNPNLDDPNNHSYYEEPKSLNRQAKGGESFQKISFPVPLKHLGALRIDPGTGINAQIGIKDISIGDWLSSQSWNGEKILEEFEYFNQSNPEMLQNDLLVTVSGNDPFFLTDSLNFNAETFEKNGAVLAALLSALLGLAFWLMIRKASWGKYKEKYIIFREENKKLSEQNRSCQISYRKEIEQFFSFLSFNKLFVAITMFFAILAYGYIICNFGLTIDGELLLVENYSKIEILKQWLTNSRFGISALKFIFNDYHIIPFWNKAVSISLLLFSAWMFSFVLENELRPQKTGKSVGAFIFSSVYITSTLSLYFIAFDTYNIEISASLVLMAVCMRVSNRFAIHHGRWGSFWMASGLLGFLISAYQAFVCVYIALFVFMLILRALQDESRIGLLNTIKGGLRYGAIMITGLIAYSAVVKLLLTISRIEDNYTGTYINWEKGLSLVFFEIIKSIGKLMLSMEGVFILPTFIFVGAIVAFSLCSKKISQKHMGILFIGLLISPFLMRIAIGGDLPARTDQALMITIAMLWYLAYVILDKLNKKVFLNGLLVIVTLLSLFQTQIIARLTAGDYQRYEQDILLAVQIDYKINEVTDGNIYKPIAFIGNKDIEQENTLIIKSLDELGKSAFEWRHPYNTRKDFFMRTLGYNYMHPSPEQFEKASEIAVTMPNWPQNGCILETEELIIVKLNDY